MSGFTSLYLYDTHLPGGYMYFFRAGQFSMFLHRACFRFFYFDSSQLSSLLYQRS